MPRVLRACLLLLAFGCLPALPSAAADQFTPAQRAEIVAIVRQALKQDPSILRDAVGALQAEDSAHAAAESQAALVAHHDMLVTTADPVAGNPQGDCHHRRILRYPLPVLPAHGAGNGEVAAAGSRREAGLQGPADPRAGQHARARRRCWRRSSREAYDKLREAVMQMPPDTTPPMIQAAAEKLGLDWPRLQHDMDAPAVQRGSTPT